MICWAVTGPMGSGKSSFSKALVGLGAVLIDADVLGHRVLEVPKIIKEIELAFGTEVTNSGVVNRSLLGRIVFNDDAALTKLNSITHPGISDLAGKKIATLARESRYNLAVFEAAVYFQLPRPPACQLIISVLAAESIRLERVMANRGLSEAEARSRIKSQLSLEKHWETADVLVHNEGTAQELEKRAYGLMLEHGLLAGGTDPQGESSS